MRKRDTAAGAPAVTLPGIVTDLDRQIVARRDAGETRKAICEALGVTVGRIYHAEYVCRRDAEGREILAECADSIYGLDCIGELESNASDCLRFHHYRHEGPELERLSDVAALGRLYVSRMKGIGPKSLASIDRVLALLGIAWSPIERTPKPKSREPERDNSQSHDAAWRDIVARVARLERVTGRCVLGDGPDRDSVDGILLRLAFLTGYLDELAAARSRRVIDVTPDSGDDADDSGEDLETAGNVVCLPGVTLASLQHDGGDDPGPSAA